jgi:hypothetical protein
VRKYRITVGRVTEASYVIEASSWQAACNDAHRIARGADPIQEPADQRTSACVLSVSDVAAWSELAAAQLGGTTSEAIEAALQNWQRRRETDQ